MAVSQDEEVSAKATTPELEVSSAVVKLRSDRREIKGGLPYSQSPGVFKRALDLIIQAERPENFNQNYLATILKITGGSARPIPALLKKMVFLNSDGSPTHLYSKFKTEGGRSQAAFEGLRNAFNELFKRNEYVYKANEDLVKDIIVEITGLKKSDKILRLIYSTFDVVRGYISGDVAGEDEFVPADETITQQPHSDAEPASLHAHRIGLSYQINIVLPETENIAVFNSIFRSLRENLLR